MHIVEPQSSTRQLPRQLLKGNLSLLSALEVDFRTLLNSGGAEILCVEIDPIPARLAAAKFFLAA